MLNLAGMIVAAIQMTSTTQKSENLAQAHELLREAQDRGAELICFPEYFSLMTDDSRQLLREAETPKEGVVVETMSEWAAEYGVWILAGSIPLRANGAKKITNSSLVFDAAGKLVRRYDKIHLFDATIPGDRNYRESKTVQAGKALAVQPIPEGKLGLSVCYDLRFPELYRGLVSQGATLLSIPSAFTVVTGRAHWDTLTRARAIENQAYVIAPAQYGTHPGGRKTHGHTRIIDPWGRILAERPAGVGVVLAKTSRDEVARVRRELPSLKNRVL